MDNNTSEQLRLFDTLYSDGIEIETAAQEAGVSIATIQNWIKTGYLKKEESGLIEEGSFAIFLKEVAGKEKLNSRANKSKKDLHDHDKLKVEILNELSDENQFNDSIGSEYEKSLSDSYRNKEGVYYTPDEIVVDMLPKTIRGIENKKFCDPSCGSGNFIIRALEIGFKPENIYGFDVDPVAVEITRKRIQMRTGFFSENILQNNFLDYAKNISVKFDYIFTNPPWGKKIEKKEKDVYSSIFETGNSADTSALFFFASLYCLNENGKLGFLLPEAFFNIAVFEKARIKALSLRIDRFIDYGKSFKGLVTKAQGIILSSRVEDSYNIDCKAGGKEFQRSSDSFKRTPKSIFNFYCDNNGAKIIEHVYSMPHITLANRAKWGLGIVTGNNKRFVKQNLEPGLIPVYKGADITYEGLKEPDMYIPKDFSLYQQVAPVSMYEAGEKIIYKFISAKLCFFHDTGQRYILNSANMIIPAKDLPVTCKQLTDLFNSRFMNWLFINIFNTHKILRSDLEALPIHTNYFEKYDEFCENTYLNFLGIEERGSGNYRIKE